MEVGQLLTQMDLGIITRGRRQWVVCSGMEMGDFCKPSVRILVTARLQGRNCEPLSKVFVWRGRPESGRLLYNLIPERLWPFAEWRYGSSTCRFGGGVLGALLEELGGFPCSCFPRS
ncbi:hypothetical protein LINPERHAP1_LOCUS14526 [Linum perenne]